MCIKNKILLFKEFAILILKIIIIKDEEYKFTSPEKLIFKNWKHFFPFVGIRNDLIERRFEEEFSKAIGCNNLLAFATGRMAIYIALIFIKKNSNKEQVVLQNGTCAVVVDSIVKAGLEPIFLESTASFGFNRDQFEHINKSNVAAIILQHNFGGINSVEFIAEYCANNGIYLIEDCALTIASRKGTSPVGSWGDFAVFSFDYSKPLNLMIGGMLSVKNSAVFRELQESKKSLPDLNYKFQLSLFLKMVLYSVESKSQITLCRIIDIIFAITYRLKILDNCSMKNDFMVKPISNPSTHPYPARMPTFIAVVGLFKLNLLSNKLQNMRENYIYFLKYFPHILDISKQQFYDSDYHIFPTRLVFRYHFNESEKIKLGKIIPINEFLFTDDWQGFIQSSNKRDKPSPNKSHYSDIVNVPLDLPFTKFSSLCVKLRPYLLEHYE